MQPDYVTAELVRAAIAVVPNKRQTPALPRLRFEQFQEGPAAQILYRGPYDAEGPMIERLHAFIAEHGHHPRGRHHEIYFGDPRRTRPENLRTVLRQPFE